jgi:hypothetical protein
MAPADLVLLAHLAFVGFALLGGLLALRWRWAPLLHLPAAAWAVLVEWMGWICPLTPLENALRRASGEPAAAGDFLARWALPLLYPAGLTRELQIVLGGAALLVNLAVYAFVLRRRGRRGTSMVAAARPPPVRRPP